MRAAGPVGILRIPGRMSTSRKIRRKEEMERGEGNELRDRKWTNKRKEEKKVAVTDFTMKIVKDRCQEVENIAVTVCFQIFID